MTIFGMCSVNVHGSYNPLVTERLHQNHHQLVGSRGLVPDIENGLRNGRNDHEVDIEPAHQNQHELIGNQRIEERCCARYFNYNNCCKMLEEQGVTHDNCGKALAYFTLVLICDGLLVTLIEKLT